MKKDERVITKVLNNYEDLIEDYEGNIKDWGQYGRRDHCLLCVEFMFHCPNCPLVKMGGDIRTGRVHPCVTLLQGRLYMAIAGSLAKGKILKAAKSRYKELIKYLATQGYTYK